MKKRREILMMLAATFAALTVIITPAIAEELLLGHITQLDPERNRLTVVNRENQQVALKITRNTVLVTATDWTIPFDFDEVSRELARYKKAGAKGIPVRVIHEDTVCSKITVVPPK